MLSCALLGLLMAAQAECATPVIFGGVAAAEQSVMSRYVVYIEDNNGEACSGTLIAPQIVVTASHCWETDASNLRVTFLVSDPRRFGLVSTGVEEAWRPTATPYHSDDPPCLARTCATDITLLRLTKPAPAGTSPMLLPGAAYPRSTAPRLLVAGYGIESDPRKGRDVGEGILRLAILNRIEPPFREPGELYTQQDSGSGICRGDSGGPAFLPAEEGLILVGISSGTIDEQSGRNTCAGIGIYTSVYPWLDRIRPIIARWTADTAEAAAPPAL